MFQIQEFPKIYCLHTKRLGDKGNLGLIWRCDDRDIQFNNDQADSEHRKAGDLQRFMFTRVPQQKAEFEQLGIPFYDPKRLANWRATHQPIWDPKQLDAFHLGG